MPVAGGTRLTEKPPGKWDVSPLSFLPLFLTASLLLINGCATTGFSHSRNLFYRGELEEAEAMMEATRGAKGRNRLLFLMERGLIYHTNEKYEKSNHDLLEAARQAEELEMINVTEQAGSFLSSDLVLTYRGEPFERVLLHTYSAISFLKLRKWEDALVECKRALKKLDRSPVPEGQPFTNYLAGICYEIMGDYDDARIEYEKVKKAHPEIPFLKNDIERVSAGRGIAPKGELICFIQVGKSPMKLPIEFFIPPDKRFIIPEYHPRNSLCKKAIVVVNPAGLSPSLSANSREKTEAAQTGVSGEQTMMFEHSESYVLTDLEVLAMKTLRGRMEKEIAREIARLVIKEKVSREVEEQSSKAAGVATRIVFMLAESGDTRSWQTLPARLEVARLLLHPGAYQVRIQFLDADNVLIDESFFEQVGIEPGKTTFLLTRSVL